VFAQSRSGVHAFASVERIPTRWPRQRRRHSNRRCSRHRRIAIGYPCS
jgi:hypothetical protein